MHLSNVEKKFFAGFIPKGNFPFKTDPDRSTPESGVYWYTRAAFIVGVCVRVACERSRT